MSIMPLVNPKRLPNSSSELLDLIKSTERTRRFVWTTGRIIQEVGLKSQLRQVSSEERKCVRQQLKKLLEELCSQGILQRRARRQSVRLDNDVGFDFVAKPAGCRVPQVSILRPGRSQN
jgi:hypothetical protein